MNRDSSGVAVERSVRSLLVTLAFGVSISFFILTSYSVPGDLTIRLAVIVALAVLVASAFAWAAHPRYPITKGVAFVLLFVCAFLLNSLPATLTTLRLALHFEHLVFGILGLLFGSVCSIPFTRWSQSRINVVVITIIIPFIGVNAVLVWGSALGTSEFNGIFRDRNYLAFYAALLIWLTHFGNFSRSASFFIRGALATFIVLSGSVGGVLMLSLYAVWRTKVGLCSAARRSFQWRLFARTGVILTMIMGVATIALFSPALERAEPIVAFMVDGELAERGSFARRYHQASEGIRVAMENPWFGVGYGSPQYYAQVMLDYGEYSLHNTYLEVWAGAGLFPILIFVAFIFFALFSALRNEWARRHGVLVALGMVLIFLMTYSTLHRMGVMFFLGFILALALEFASGRTPSSSNRDGIYLRVD